MSQEVSALLLLLMLLPLTAFAQEDGQVEGRLIEAETSRPLVGATVVLQADDADHGTTTDADGYFSLEGVAPGLYELEARMIGYETHTLALEVEAGELTTVENLTLNEATYGMEGVTVSATRMSIPLSAVSGAVTVVDADQVEKQKELANGVGDVLGKLVPGLGAGTGTPSIYGQSLRGRTMSVMIDGIPQSTTRNTSRDLTTVDPGMIERVEVIRGATALYGDGATGGIINIITARPDALSPEFTTEANFGGSLSAPGEGLETSLLQRASGRTGPLDYTVSGTYTRTSGFYDGEGDLIPPDPYGQGGLAMTSSWDVHGKFGYAREDDRFELTLNHFWSEQETAYRSDPSVDTLPAREAKAEAKEGLHLEENQGSQNTLASLDYHRDNLLGGSLHGQVFLRDYLTRFHPFDGRSLDNYQAIIQSYLESTKYGARLEWEQELHAASGLQLLTGLDYTDERTQQPALIIDPETYDESGGLVYETAGERPWVPLMKPRKLGLFGQLSWSPLAALDLQGGVRYERARMQIDGFKTLVGGEVTGGRLAYDPVLVNLGAVVHLTGATSLYGSFSQGFSLTDIGLLLRDVPDGFEVGSHTLEAQTVNNYEIGARGNWSRVRATLSGFYNTSELGTTSGGLEEGVIRAPERVYGLEATLDVSPTDALELGGTFTWTEGENDANEDGEYLALDSFRIQPLKLTGYAEHQTTDRWQTRLQVLYSGNRDRAFEEAGRPEVPGFGLQPVESYVVVDLISTIEAGPGQLKLGVENLFNEQYFPVVSQLLWNGQNSSHAAAPGASFSLGYVVKY